MGNDSPKDEYRNARDRIDTKHDEGAIPDEDYELIEDFLDAKDPDIVMIGDGDTKAYSTLKSYGYRLMWTTIRFEGDTTLATASARDINKLMSGFLTGRNPDVKDDGMANKTVRLYQSCLRSFYDYHDDLGIDPDEIVYAERDDSSVDERDMYTEEEVEAMRDACPNPRDRCILELLLNTGQRIRAIQTLRIKDIDLDEGVFWLNTEEDGLKGAEGKRPLLGARAAVRDWIGYHPTGESDDYLITGLHNYNRDKGDTLSRQHIRRRVSKVADEAGIDKPTNPHQWRHYCVTMLKRDYDLDNDTIKWLIGHGPDSRVMETTYSHLSDQDRIETAEISMGIREDMDNSPLTPPRCPTCDNPLSSHAKACDRCGEVFAPDAKAVAEQVDDAIYKEKGNADGEMSDAVDTLRDIVKNNPEFKRELLEEFESV